MPQSPPPSGAPSRSGRGLLIAVALLALIGLGLSVELTRVHVLLYSDPDYAPGCDLNQRFSCSTVERSAEAVLAGLPLSVWGMLGYVVLLGVALSGWRAAGRGVWPRGALLGLGLLYSAMSIYNAAVSLLVLGALCPFCLGTYAVNFAVLAVALVAARRHPEGLLGCGRADLRALRDRLPISGAAALVFGGTVVALWLALPRYWEKEAGAATHVGAGGLPTGTTPAGSHWIGAEHPAVTIEAFSDYECPHCAMSHEVLRKAVAAQPDRLRVVHRHYPLDIECNKEMDRPFHRYACLAAKAVECAGAQGKYWELSDRVFASHQRLNASTLRKLYTETGLDVGALEACIQGEAVQALIDHDVEAGAAHEVTGTPFFFINGRIYKGGLTDEILARLIADSPFGGTPNGTSAAAPADPHAGHSHP